MVEFPGVYLEAWLILLIGDTISHSCTEHHLRASHEVPHYVLQFGHKSFLINQEKVNFFFSRDLDPNISANEKYLAPHFIKVVVLGP